MNKISNVRIKKSNTKSFTGLRIISENVNSVNDAANIISNIPEKISLILHKDIDDIDTFFVMSIPEKFYGDIKTDLCVDGFPERVDGVVVYQPVVLKIFPQVLVISDSSSDSEVNVLALDIGRNSMDPTEPYKTNPGEYARIYMKKKLREFNESKQKIGITIHPCFKAYFVDYYDDVTSSESGQGSATGPKYCDICNMKDKYKDRVQIWFKYDMPCISFDASDINDDGTIDRVYSISMVGLPMY